jgi:hypothetical protein
MIFCCEPTKAVVDNFMWLDATSKFATITIAIFNLILTIFIFKSNYRKNQVDKEQDRKLQLFKTLVLDHNLKEFYLFFTNLDTSLQKLKVLTLTDSDRQSIINESDSHFISLTRNFIDTLLAIDKNLYDTVLNSTDEFQAELNGSISDKGIVLSHQPKFDEIITQNLTRSKTQILTILYNYR